MRRTPNIGDYNVFLENSIFLLYNADIIFGGKIMEYIVEQTAKAIDIPFESVLIDSREKARNAPVAWTNYGVFYN